MSVQPQQPEQLSLSLPYEEITSVLGRTAIRAKFKITSKESYKVPFADIEVRDGYNKRHVYEDMETAVEWVKANTVDGICELDPPLMVDFLEDGRVKILRGHRRFKAMQIAIEQGLVINLVVCTPTAKDMTELDRVVDIYASNMHQSKLKPVEQAEVCFSLKHNFDKISNEEIAAKLNISRQKVDYLLLIAEAGDDIKNEILHGDMTLTDAVAYVRKQKKLDKQTDQVEEDSRKNIAGKTPFPKDMLADELAELKELEQFENPEHHLEEETAEEKNLHLLREQTKRDQEHEQLMEVSDEIKVKKLKEHIGRKLSAPAVRHWTQDFVDEDTGNIIPIERSQVLLAKGDLINERVIEQFKDYKEIGIDTIFVYKKGMEPIAASVITEPVAQKDKDKYDSGRPEIAQIQNIIKLADKIEAVVNKLDCPDGTKTDIANFVKWLQKDAAELRDWVHTNKKQNKMR